MSGLPEVIARMQAIEDGLPRTDGIACFTQLYLAVTEGVNAELAGAAFGAPRWLEDLDVTFADLYFDAVHDPGRAPRAWLPLFEARSRKGIAPIQFALAGMNAHINRDLPLAIVDTCVRLGVELRPEGPEHHDYLRVNGVLARVEARVKRPYLTGGLAALDRIFHRTSRLDDVVAMWNVSRARDAAWANALALWQLRASAALRDQFVASLDRMVGLAGRGLLVPADTVLGRLGRFLRRP